ncbi:MAG: extracellular solute-binding protein, partial [Anaerolineae bacterium]
MSDLEFTFISSYPEEIATLKAELAEFEARTGISVRTRQLDWREARDALNQVAIYNEGPDVSQIGSTWLRSLVDMNALRPFSARDLRALGRPSDFVDAAWESVHLPNQPETWAMPWLMDARHIYYRRDLLKQQGIDEQEAFTTPQAMEETLDRLQAAGVEVPLTLPTRDSWMTLHNAASWVWQAGGDFVDARGQNLTFHEPQAVTGFKSYFGLERYLTPPARGLTDTESDKLFWSGKAAVTLSGPWLLSLHPDERIDQVGVTSPPGPPFIGGSHLVVWKHVGYAPNALRLVRHLTSLRFQSTFGTLNTLLPARLKAFEALNTESRAFGKYLRRSLTNGRT